MAIDNMDGMLDVLTEEDRARREEEEIQEQKARTGKVIDRWFERLDHAKKHDKKYRKQWADDRKLARGESDQHVTANLIQSSMEVLLAFLYAKNPDAGVRPSPSVTRYVSDSQDERDRQLNWREFAKTIEIIISRSLTEARFKRTAKRWVRGAMTTGCAWVKAILQTRNEVVPIVENRINDLRDQLSKIKAGQAELEFDSETDRDVKIEEIEANITAAEAKREQTVAEGWVIDYMHVEDVIVAPECGEVENYLASPWIAFNSYKSASDVIRITGWTEKETLRYLKSATKYNKRPRKGDDEESGEGYVQADTEDESEAFECFYRVVEIWSKTDGVIYTAVEGCRKQWAREPYAPVTSKRFYPGFLLGFHWVDGERYPQSVPRHMQSLQEEFNETRSDFRTHRRRAKPGVIFDKGSVAAESVSAITGATTEEFIGVDLLEPGQDIRTIFFPKSYNRIDPGLYDTSPTIRDMERVTGVQESLQSGISVEKTATEAQIQDRGFGARSGARRDEVEDIMSELAWHMAEVSLQLMDNASAFRYAGPGAVWHQMSADDAANLFEISVKAGSTGKPQALQDRETWSQLLPLFMQLIQRIGAARIAGQEWAAEPWIALMAETLERMDDHADLEAFLPKPPMELVQAQSEDAGAEAETELTKAKRVKELASAVEKVPEFALTPEVKALFGYSEQQPPATVQ